jgi:hypothetical protein
MRFIKGIHQRDIELGIVLFQKKSNQGKRADNENLAGSSAIP